MVTKNTKLVFFLYVQSKAIYIFLHRQVKKLDGGGVFDIINM